MTPATVLKCIRFWNNTPNIFEKECIVSSWALNEQELTVNAGDDWIPLSNQGGEGSIYARVPRQHFAIGMQQVGIRSEGKTKCVLVNCVPYCCSDRYREPSGRLKETELMLDFNEFLLPQLHRAVSKLLIREMVRRKIDPQNFVRASWDASDFAIARKLWAAVDPWRESRKYSESIHEARAAAATLAAYIEVEMEPENETYELLSAQEMHDLICPDGDKCEHAIDSQESPTDAEDKLDEIANAIIEAGLRDKIGVKEINKKLCKAVNENTILNSKPCLDYIESQRADGRKQHEVAKVLCVSPSAISKVAGPNGIIFDSRKRNFEKLHSQE